MAKSDVLGEFDKYFRIKQGESTIDIPKNKISEALQEQMRAQIKPAEVIETDTFNMQPSPMPEPIAQSMPQQQMAPPQPMAQPQMQPQMPREVIQKETIYPQAQGGVGQQINALEQIGHFEGQKALENAKLYNQANDELIRGEAERTQKVQQYQQDVNSHFQDYEKNVNELASAKVDPDRFWKSKSMPQKAAAYIGIILSGIGAGLTGKGGNSALDVINKAIDRDIDAQRDELNTKSKQINFQNNLLGLMRHKYQDEASAEAATRATMYEKLKLQTQAQAALYDSPIIQQRAQQAIGQLNEQKAKYDQEMGLKFQEMAFRKSEAATRHAIEYAKLGLASQKDQLGQPNEKLQVGSLGEARTEREAIEARDTLQSGQSFLRKLEDLIELRREHGSEWFGGAVSNKMLSLRKELMADYKQMKKLGTLDAGVEKLFEQLIPDPTGVGYRVEVYEQLKQNAAKDLENDIRSKLRTGFKSNGSSQIKSFQPAK